MAISRTSFTVETNGQTLVVDVSPSTGRTEPVLYSNAAISSAVTLPQTITSNTTYYIDDAFAGGLIVSVKQLDGTELFGKAVKLEPGKPKTITPVPSALQAGADTGRGLQYKSGNYYLLQSGFAVSGVAMTLSQLRLAPWRVDSTVSIAKIGAEVQSAGSAGSLFRIGIYADDGYNYPGALVLDAGTIDGTSATVQDITLGSPTVLTPGMYWVGGAAQVAAPTMRVYTTQMTPSYFPQVVGTSAPGVGAAVYGYTQASVTGALPATFTTTVIAANAQPARIHIKTS